MSDDPASKRAEESMAAEPRHHQQPLTYRDEDLQLSADAINVSLERVLAVSDQLEAAATWRRLDAREPQRTPPSKRKAKLNAVTKATNRLMKALHIPSSDAAGDGPGDQDIAEWLAEEAGDERRLLAATESVGNIAEWASAAAERKMPPDYKPPKTFQGDVAANDWVAAVLSIYAKLTEREVGTSVNLDGAESGPLIRFLIAATNPPLMRRWFDRMGVKRSPAAWRSRIRAIRAMARSPRK